MLSFHDLQYPITADTSTYMQKAQHMHACIDGTICVTITSANIV